MRKLFVFILLSSFCVVFSQENSRKYNLVVAFDSSMSIDRYNALADISAQIVEFSDVLESYPFDLKYSFVFSEEKLQQMEEQALRISGNSKSIQDLRNIYDVVNDELTDEDLKQLANRLQRLPNVSYAELVDAKPVKPPFDISPITPDFVLQQTYIYMPIRE